MMTSTLDLLIPKPLVNEEELANVLESLPSYESLNQTSDEPAVFDEEKEPSSGLIEQIRHNSQSEEPGNIPSPINDIEDSIKTNVIDDDSELSSGLATDSIDERRDSKSNENNDMGFLKKRMKHFFILSENGKPVYTRYGDEDQLVTLMGVMQTLVSFSELTDSSQIRYLKAGRCRIAFLHKGPLILVIVTHHNEHPASLSQQLTYAYSQIISTLTLSRIQNRFKSQPNFDLRRWLSNAEKKLLHNIIDMYEQDLGMLMSSAKCLILPTNIRSQIGQAVAQTIRGQKDMIFALILVRGHLVSIARLQNQHLHPSDLHLLINLVDSSDAFKGVQSWVPVCLPRFDPSGCFHAYISYVDDSCDVCLVLLTINPEHFQILSDFKQTISDKLRKNNLIVPIKLALEKSRYLCDDIDCPELRYFAYKSRGLGQYISSKLTHPYQEHAQRVRLFELIRFVYGRLHHPTHHAKIVFYTTEHEALLGWLSPGFELHIVLSPLITLENVVICINRILSFIKREENQLFIIHCEYF